MICARSRTRVDHPRCSLIQIGHVTKQSCRAPCPLIAAIVRQITDFAVDSWRRAAVAAEGQIRSIQRAASVHTDVCRQPSESNVESCRHKSLIAINSCRRSFATVNQIKDSGNSAVHSGRACMTMRAGPPQRRDAVPRST